MKLKNYGVLIPCGQGMFTGVEYVCCPKEMKIEKPKEEQHPVRKLIGGAEDVNIPTKKPLTLIEKLEKETKKYPKHMLGKVIGMYHSLLLLFA